MQQNIVVLSYARDLHADAILWGLEALGHSASLWQPHHFPADQALSITLAPPDPVRHCVDSPERSFELGRAKTIWARRVGPPHLAPGVDPRDRDFAQRESEQHLSGFLATAAADAFWVNPPRALDLDTNKPYQLQVAMEVGFTIPATLASNAPDRIRAFFERHGGRIVYKSYLPQCWEEGDDKPSTYKNNTAAVSADDLRSDRVLAMCPGLFQERIDKAFEVRVTVMGNSVFAVRLDAPGHEAGQLDWRNDRAGTSVSAFGLPDEIGARCRAYMKRFGIVFGCFDFIVAPSGDYYFLEVNPMGQFLWQEERVPELPLLDAMCAFLASADPDFTWERPRAPLAFADYRAWRESRQSPAAPSPRLETAEEAA